MNCRDARDALLGTDVRDLDCVDPGTMLGSHLAACRPCRTLAVAIASDTSRLGRLLDGRHRVRRRAARRRGIALLATVPIAAALLAAASTMRDRGTTIVPASGASAQTRVAREVSLTVEPGQRATVLKTADPNVTLIWLSPGDGQ
jgi:hypothetical protein